MYWGLLVYSLLVAHSAAMQGFGGIDPCVPHPCGPNTDCSVSPSGIAICRCKPGFFPKPDTITGCGPQCVSDSECAATQQCNGGRCVNPCDGAPCGQNALCEVRNSRAICKCPSGYTGDPFTSCVPAGNSDSRILSGGSVSSHSVNSFSTFSGRPSQFSGEGGLSAVSGAGFNRQTPSASSSDLCASFSCGSNADCVSRSNRPVCSCRSGFEGDPYTGCRRAECLENAECPATKVCHNFKCINPCSTSCGVDSECEVRNHVTVCRCPKGYEGDPFVSCTLRSATNTLGRQSQDYCNPTPCGANSKCRVENGRAVCSCQDGYIGNPIQGCTHECDTDAQCAADRACVGFRCQDPCTSCGQYAECRVNNHRSICSCPVNFLGDPFTRCYPECTQHDECRAKQACFNLKCVDPCDGACGTGAECRVDNHKAICSCPKGTTGHPFDKCRPFDKSDLCNPNPCGDNADCKPGTDRSGNDRPVCFCRAGFLGDPLVSCRRGQCEQHTD